MKERTKIIKRQEETKKAKEKINKESKKEERKKERKKKKKRESLTNPVVIHSFSQNVIMDISMIQEIQSVNSLHSDDNAVVGRD